MGKSSSTPAAPEPDENIGKAALMQAELGQQWLEFAKVEASNAADRQVKIDALTTQIGNQQLAINDQMLEWADQDRAWATDDRDRALEREQRLDQWGQEDRSNAMSDRERALWHCLQQLCARDAGLAVTGAQRKRRLWPECCPVHYVAPFCGETGGVVAARELPMQMKQRACCTIAGLQFAVLVKQRERF